MNIHLLLHQIRPVVLIKKMEQLVMKGTGIIDTRQYDVIYAH